MSKKLSQSAQETRPMRQGVENPFSRPGDGRRNVAKSIASEEAVAINRGLANGARRFHVAVGHVEIVALTLRGAGWSVAIDQQDVEAHRSGAFLVLIAGDFDLEPWRAIVQQAGEASEASASNRHQAIVKELVEQAVFMTPERINKQAIKTLVDLAEKINQKTEQGGRLFRLEVGALGSVRDALRAADWMTATDLTDLAKTGTGQLFLASESDPAVWRAKVTAAGAGPSVA